MVSPSLILIHWETFVSLCVDRKESVVRGTFENTEKRIDLGTQLGVLVLERRGVSFEQNQSDERRYRDILKSLEVVGISA